LGTVLVTGGCGYIGSHTCISLIKSGYKVVIFDSLINSYESSYKKILKILQNENIDYAQKINFIKGDLRNKKILSKLFLDKQREGEPIFSVIHFAGLKSAGESLKSPLEYWEANVESTLSLLKVMEKFSCHSIIFSSSASVYKPKEFGLLSEEDFLEPSSPYGRTKLTIEKILKDLFTSNSEKWRIANLRYFNPVGAHDSGLLGENPKVNFSNLFPAINLVLNKKKSHLFIFGNNWPTKDGTCIRDFIHVTDLAEAHVATLNYILKNSPKCVNINVGRGIGASVLEVLNMFKDIGIKIPYLFVKKRAGDHPFLVADNKLALKLLDWSPKRNLIDMCKDSLNNVLCE
tara:strand:- start:1205 stop:2242 length:1038 start_codon:yes stop_codon:yes gene_type:complete